MAEETQLSQDSLFSRRFVADMPERFEQFGRGVVRGWLYDDSLAVHKAYIDTDGVAVGAWYDMTLDTFANWTPAKTYLSIEYLQNVSRVAISTDVQEKMKVLAKSFPYIAGKSALVVPRKSVTMSFRRFFNKTLHKLQPELEREIFHHYEDALNWLCEGIEVRQQQSA